jgi:hypothetical protein
VSQPDLATIPAKGVISGEGEASLDDVISGSVKPHQVLFSSKKMSFEKPLH